MRTRHPRFDYKLEIDAKSVVIVVGMAENPQVAWWDAPFAQNFVPDEWQATLQDYFWQKKSQQERLSEAARHAERLRSAVTSP